MKLASLFDGSGGFTYAAVLEGINPVWASEIEPFPIRVTTIRMPYVKHYGDVASVDGWEVEPVDVLTFGSPCQDLSVAGKRAGLKGDRSNLFYQAIRIVREMRVKTNGRYPRYIVWENVPGAFSSNKGEDFRCVLSTICQIKDDFVSVPRPAKWQSSGLIMGDDFSVAWRVLDAQYWGVPQRRKRIFLVADFADRGGAAEILFKPESVSGDTSQSGVKRKENSGCLGESSETAVRGMLFENHSQDDRYRELKDCAMSVTANYGTGGNNQPFVVQPSAYRLCAQNSNSMMSDNPNSGIYATNVSSTLDTSNQSPCRNQGGIVVIENSENTSAYGLDRASFNQGRNAKYDFSVTKESEPTMTARGPNAVAHPVYTTSKASYHTEAAKDVANTLVASDFKDPPTVTEEPYYIVRRLTPTECARLQGFPDWWCDGLGTEQPTEDEMAFWTQVFRTHSEIMGTAMKSRKQIEKWLREPHTDSAEYKMWGNGVALPCVRYIMHNIAERHQG